HPSVADLVDEVAVGRELQHVRVIPEGGRPGKLPGEVLAIARDVDEVVVVYEDPVLPSGPLAAVLLTAPLLQEPGVGGAAPRLKEVALFVELEDRRRGYAAARVLPVGPGMA